MEHFFLTLILHATALLAVHCQDYFSNECFDGYSYDSYSYSYSYSSETISFSSFDWYGDEEVVYFFESNDTSFHLCPAVHLCNHDGDPPVCSCHPSCVYFKTCCYDESTFNGHPNRTARSSSLGDWTIDDFVCVETTAPLRGHHMIGKCPPSWEDDYIRHKCEDVSTLFDENVFEFADAPSIIPVVKTGNITFRNGFCATCHSVSIDQLVSWKMEIHCQESKFANLEEDLQGTLNGLGEECRVNLEPPIQSVGLAVLPCFPREVKTACEDEFLPITVDESVATLQQNCLTNLAPLCLSDGTVYKNPECVLCNYPKKTFPYGFRGQYCFRMTPLLSPTLAGNAHLGFKDPDKIVPLSVVFDFSSSSGLRFEKEGLQYEENGVLCGEGEVFDPFRGECIALSCPEGYYFSMGGCSPVTEDKSYCRHRNSTPDTIITAVYRASWNGSEDLLNMYSKVCISDALHIPSHVLRRVDDKATATTDPSHVTWDPSHIDVHDDDTADNEDFFKIQFSVNRSSTNINYLLHNLQNLDIHDFTRDIGMTDEKSSASVRLRQVCGNFISVRFHSGCEDLESIKSSCSPYPIRKETTWSITEEEGLILVDSPRLEWPRPLQDVNILVDVSIDDHGKVDVSKKASFCDDLRCPTLEVNASEFHNISLNGTAALQHVTNENVFILSSEYRFLNNGLLKLCSSVLTNDWAVVLTDTDRQHVNDRTQAILSTIGICLSVICLWCTILIYILFPSLRRTASNRLTVSFCLFLSLSQASSLVLALPTYSTIFCSAVAIATHYLWLVTFTTTSVIGFDMNQAFAWRPMTHSMGEGKCRLLKYLSVCYGLPLVVIIPFTSLHFYLQDESPIRYGNSLICWISDPQWIFYGIAIPLAVCMACNVFFFVHTVREINKTRQTTAKMNDSGRQKPLQDVFVFFKISLQMGFTWATSFIANLTGSPIAWYIFILLNSMQGVLIFIVFILGTRVRKLLTQKLGFSTVVQNSATNRSTRSTTDPSIRKFGHSETKI